jgi:phenylalanyl-tRNA synthetase beta chain
MHVSTFWLKNILSFPTSLNLKEIKNRLTICGFEFEEIKIINLLNKKDIIFDLKTTSNRPDLLSVIGLTEELNILLGSTKKKTKIKLKDFNFFSNYSEKIKIETSTKLFPSTVSFILTKINNINFKKTQPWIKERLFSYNIKLENNLNDIKQYLLLEWGQPIFFYDFDKIKYLTKNQNPKISIRFAYKNEVFIDSDLKEYFLKNETLVVTADNIPISVAGSIISNNCCIDETTKNIIIEASIYEPKDFRKSERTIGVRTTASLLFERGINKFLIKSAHNRLFNILNSLNNNSFLNIEYCLIFFEKILSFRNKINLSFNNVEKILFIDSYRGSNESKNKIYQSLKKMQFNFAENEGNSLIVSIPFTRNLDIQEEIDLIEEIARLTGFNNFLPILITTKKLGTISKFEKFKREIRSTFINLGFLELFNFSLTSENNSNNIFLINALITEYSFLRINLIKQLINGLEKNIKEGNSILPIFEFGRNFQKINNEIIKEEELVSGIFCNTEYKQFWSEKNIDLNWFQVKGFLEIIFFKLNLSYFFVKTIKVPEYYNSQNTLSIILNNEQVGLFGKINPKIAYKKNIPINCFLFEIELTKLYKHKKQQINNILYKQYSIFPNLIIDLSLLIPKSVNFDKIKNLIVNNAGNLLKKIELFDLYQNIQSNNDFYSLGIKLTFRSVDKTLLKNEIDHLLLNIENELQNQLNIKIRQ